LLLLINNILDTMNKINYAGCKSHKYSFPYSLKNLHSFHRLIFAALKYMYDFLLQTYLKLKSKRIFQRKPFFKKFVHSRSWWLLIQFFTSITLIGIFYKKQKDFSHQTNSSNGSVDFFLYFRMYLDYE